MAREAALAPVVLARPLSNFRGRVAARTFGVTITAIGSVPARRKWDCFAWLLIIDDQPLRSGRVTGEDPPAGFNKYYPILSSQYFTFSSVAFTLSKYSRWNGSGGIFTFLFNEPLDCALRGLFIRLGTKIISASKLHERNRVSLK